MVDKEPEPDSTTSVEESPSLDNKETVVVVSCKCRAQALQQNLVKLAKIRARREKEVVEEERSKKKLAMMKKRRDGKKKQREEKNLLNPILEESKEKEEVHDIGLNKMMKKLKMDPVLINEYESKDKLCLNDRDKQVVKKEERISEEDVLPHMLARCGNKTCDEKQAFHRCGKCKSIAYCSVDCAKIDHGNHTIDCRNMRSLPNPNYHLRPENPDRRIGSGRWFPATSFIFLKEDNKTTELNSKEEIILNKKPNVETINLKEEDEPKPKPEPEEVD